MACLFIWNPTSNVRNKINTKSKTVFGLEAFHFIYRHRFFTECSTKQMCCWESCWYSSWPYDQTETETIPKTGITPSGMLPFKQPSCRVIVGTWCDPITLHRCCLSPLTHIVFPCVLTLTLPPTELECEERSLEEQPYSKERYEKTSIVQNRTSREHMQASLLLQDEPMYDWLANTFPHICH